MIAVFISFPLPFSLNNDTFDYFFFFFITATTPAATTATTATPIITGFMVFSPF